MKRVAGTTTLTLCLLLAWAIGASHAATPWKLSGVHMEPCRCAIPCKHVTEAAETSLCQGFDIFHIVEGFSGDIALDNLDFAVMSEDPPGPRDDADWIMATYVAKEASPDQVAAIQKIVDELFGPMVAEDLGVKSVPISFEMSGDTYKLSIPDILEIESVLLPNKPSVPGYFGTPFLQAQAVVQKYKDYGREWDFGGRNSWHSNLLLQGGGPTAVSPLTWGKIKQRYSHTQVTPPISGTHR